MNLHLARITNLSEHCFLIGGGCAKVGQWQFWTGVGLFWTKHYNSKNILKSEIKSYLIELSLLGVYTGPFFLQ